MSMLGNLGAMLENVLTALGLLDDHHGNTFLLIWGSVQTLLDQLDSKLQKFINNSFFIQKIKFQLLSAFLMFIFV